MADTNKRKRKEDCLGESSTGILQTKATDFLLSEQFENGSGQQNLQQTVYLNQVPLLQNQQLIYQVEGVQNINSLNFANGNNPQNLVYIVIPTAEGVPAGAASADISGKDKMIPQAKVTQKHDANNSETKQVQDKYYMEDIQFQAYSNQSLNVPLDICSAQEIQPAPNNTQFEEVYLVDNALSANNATDKNVSNVIRTHGYKCDYHPCSMAFGSVYEKKAHMESHLYPESTEFKCNICNSVFAKAVDRNKHVESHRVVNTYKCKTCNLSFPYYTSLVKHIDENKCISKDKLRCCIFCGSKFVSERDLAKHQELNLKTCVCKSKICGEHSFEVHLNLCSVHKNKQTKCRKKLKTDDLDQ